MKQNSDMLEVGITLPEPTKAKDVKKEKEVTVEEKKTSKKSK